MSNNTSHPYTIVVGVDFEPDGNHAIDAAIELAEARGGNAEIHLVYVDTELTPRVAGVDAGMAGYEREVNKRTQTALDELEKTCRERAAAAKGGQALATEGLTAHFRLGRAAEQIVQLAADLDGDLIVVGTH